ncbi:MULTISPECIES: L-aspartate oxidase [unclassified Arthrobacter]|uniref:L-aspartate oxidase n=1 Tax=unclassified Arthrobacter TaxID=235627 RepID=UPI001490ABA9|nr:MULTISPECIES: L-aspartate oxidase [unclassified Arthrobacter]MBE0010491.1 L-aspartate oxidase [Arthrobacter sp. AET 35A]NOJ62348.1 L-aspartate oxidase [Arthrobacter sp. 147(2020)]
MTAAPLGRVLVVGSGIAGLYAALCLQRSSPRTAVILATKGELEHSNTWHAQGGIAAVLPNPAVGQDSVADHIADTLAAGGGACVPDAVQALCSGAADHIAALLDLGTPFDRTPAGELALGREAAHSASRILHAGGDATGAAVARALIAAVLHNPGIEVLDHCFLADLLTEGAAEQSVRGALLLREGEPITVDADAVVLATGGAGQLFAHNTNPLVATGDGLAAAWRAGAVVKDLEFFQFHPTALDVPGNLLISEAVRGEGAVLRDASGNRFMSTYHPAAELAPRDVISRSIALHLRDRGEDRVYLDATGLGADFLASRFPSLHRHTAAHGFDWAVDPLPVIPAAHYWMGGIQTDLWGRTSLPGLYAIGEAACTGVHGANRLASNSLLEGLVFAGRAVAAITSQAVTSHALTPGWPRFAATGLRFPDGERREVCDRRTLQQLMSDHAAVTRSAAGLQVAAKQLDQFAGATGSPEERETGNLLTSARLLVHAAAAREESLGAHYRTDFPGRAVPGSAPHSTAFRRSHP